MKKIYWIFMVLMLLILTSCNVSSPAQAPTPLNLIPSMEDLAGSYEDGFFSYVDVYVSDKLMAEAQGRADAADASKTGLGVIGEVAWLGILESLLALEGFTSQAPFTITVVSEESGVLQFAGDESADVDTPMQMTFIYNPDNGIMTIDMKQNEARTAGSLSVSYIEENKIEVYGTLRTTFFDIDEKDFYMDLKITGTKPLGSQ